MKKIDIAVIGIGTIAETHLVNITANEALRLAGVCDIDLKRAEAVGKRYEVPAFSDYRELLAKDLAQAVIVATPHFSHAPIAIDSLRRGVHVLVEKPIAALGRAATEMTAEYESARIRHPGLVFAAMFVYRSYERWRQAKQLLDARTLGRLQRATWIATDWFRTQAYYASGDWRATWRGEGGGLLLNQCVHNLDIYQWLFGMPSRVSGFASLGKYHTIEVEDEVSAFFHHGDGMVGHFIASTAESPGTDRLEVVGELGRMVVEPGRLTLDENRSSAFEVARTSGQRFVMIPSERHVVDFPSDGEQAAGVLLANFVNAILRGEELIAPAGDGHGSVTLANAILMSSIRGTPAEIPLDETAYAELLENLTNQSARKSAR